MSIESHKVIVRRYFEEVLDRRNLDILGEIVATGSHHELYAGSELYKSLYDGQSAATLQPVV